MIGFPSGHGVSQAQKSLKYLNIGPLFCILVEFELESERGDEDGRIGKGDRNLN
jgi:hypothetical protein